MFNKKQIKQTVTAGILGSVMLTSVSFTNASAITLTDSSSGVQDAIVNLINTNSPTTGVPTSPSNDAGIPTNPNNMDSTSISKVNALQLAKGYSSRTESSSSTEYIYTNSKGYKYSVRNATTLTDALDDFNLESGRKPLGKQKLNFGANTIYTNKGYIVNSKNTGTTISYSSSTLGVTNLTVKKGKFYYKGELFTGDITKSASLKDNKTTKLIVYKGLVYANIVSKLSIKKTLEYNYTKPSRTSGVGTSILSSAKISYPTTTKYIRDWIVYNTDYSILKNKKYNKASFYLGDKNIKIAKGYIVNEKGLNTSFSEKTLGIPLIKVYGGKVYEDSKLFSGSIETIIINKNGVAYIAKLKIYSGLVVSTSTEVL